MKFEPHELPNMIHKDLPAAAKEPLSAAVSLPIASTSYGTAMAEQPILFRWRMFFLHGTYV